MMKMTTQKILIILTFIIQVQSQKTQQEFWLRSEHSLTKPYTQANGFLIPNWDFNGNTIITDQYIRLTSDRPSQIGGLWNSVPVTMLNWEVHIQYKIHGKNSSNLFGDGFIFWYSKDRMIPGPVFGSKDHFYGLAVAVDTYNNNPQHGHSHPYISAMVNNGSLHYDHDLDGSTTEVGGCERKELRNSEHDTWLSVRYDQDVLTVSTYTATVPGVGKWENCFTVKGIILPIKYYFGFSSATGQLSDNHDLVTFQVYELASPRGRSVQDPTVRSRVLPAALKFDLGQEGTGPTSDPDDFVRPAIRAFLLALSVVIAFAAIGMLTFSAFEGRMDNSRKRFY